MYALVILWLIAWGMVPVPECGGRLEAAPARSTAAPAEPTVAVKRTDPVQIVFVEHRGPYWAVGPVLARVREYMLEHAQLGPMFVRYLSDPLGAGQGSLRAQVGFVAKDSCRPEPPFKSIQRSRELVAYMVVEGRSSAPRLDYPVVREWIQAHGYVAAGPVTEIYENAPPGRRTGPQRTEIQITLRAVPPRENRDAPSVVGKPSQATPAPPDQTAMPGASPVEVGKMDVHADTTTRESDAMTGPDVEPSPEVIVGTTPEETPDKCVAEASEPSSYTSEAERVKPVAELIASGQFDRIAQQLMPDGRVIPGSHQVWLGQVVFRIGAVAKGIKQVYPGEERVAGAMAGAIMRRYKKISAAFQLDPLDHATVRFDVRMDPLADQKRAVMRDVDTLLARIAFHSVGAEAAVEELAEIVQRVQDLMCVQEATSPRPQAPH